MMWNYSPQKPVSALALLIFANSVGIFLFGSLVSRSDLNSKPFQAWGDEWKRAASLQPFSSDNGAFINAPRRQNNLVLLQFGTLELYQLMSLLHARRTHPHDSITVLRDEEADMSNGTWSILQDAYINVFTFDAKHNSARRELRKIYRHASSNDLEYEFACLARYFSLQYFLHAHNLPSAVLLDIDIVLFGDIFEILPPNTTFYPHSTFATHWTRPSLDLFCEHIMQFYSRPNGAIVADIVKYGQRFHTVDEGTLKHTELMRLWWPGNTELYLFSDMHMLFSFIFEHGIISSQCMVLQACEEEIRHFVLPVSQIPGVDCSSPVINMMLGALSWRYVDDFIVFPHTVSSGQRVPGLHFQGPCKRLITRLEPLCENLNFKFEGNACSIPDYWGFDAAPSL